MCMNARRKIGFKLTFDLSLDIWLVGRRHMCILTTQSAYDVCVYYSSGGMSYTTQHNTGCACRVNGAHKCSTMDVTSFFLVCSFITKKQVFHSRSKKNTKQVIHENYFSVYFFIIISNYKILLFSQQYNLL